jgi:ABC-type branched-subunit amino acid transport system ATPase component/branched-subunit amino acid ABC-type transport system permease component
MNEFLPFIIAGLATGAVYGLAGMGVVLTFKTSGILNFGYGSIAAADSFVFYALYVNLHWAWPFAAAVALLVVAPILGLLMELLARSLSDSSETIKVVATVGIILIVEAIALLWNGTSAPTFPHFLSQSTVRILGTNVTWEQVILFVFSLVAGAALYLFFRYVRLGVLMRGVVDNHELVSMSGDDPVRVRRWAWVIGTVFASAAGLLLAPTMPVDGVTLPIAVFSAFGAAAIGYFASLPLTFAGGLLIGIAGALIDKYAATISWLSGIPASLPFIVLFLVLILIPRARLVQRRLVPVKPTLRSYTAPGRVRLGSGVIVIALLALVPTLQGSHVAVWSEALIDVILFLSLGLLVRKSGQISLCQLAFAAVGAASFGHFAPHMPWLLALILATLVAAPVGAVIAIPAVRISGVFLALATLGFGILMEQVFYSTGLLFGDNPLGLNDPRPDFSIGGWNLSSDNGFYYLILIITVLVALFVTSIGRGRLGRLLEALSDSPVALETHGVDSSVLKVIVFCISACIASLAGALTGMLYSFALGSYFPSFTSLELVVLVVIIVIGDPWYAVVAAIGYAVVPGYITSETTSTWLTLLFGVTAALAAYGARGFPMPMAMQQFLNRLGGRRTSAATAGGSPVQARTLSVVPAPAPAEPRDIREKDGRADRAADREGLVLEGVSVSFGGVKAVNGVSLAAPMGQITGLIGPNGAGKTTLFNASTGLVRLRGGDVYVLGSKITRYGPAARARRGLGRTFQQGQLFDRMTVRQNVAMGREAPLAGRNPFDQVFGPPRESRDISAAAAEAMELTGITRLADEQAGLLTIGQRRLVELARALAGQFDMLLLDEPSSGLDAHETQRFGQVLRSVVDQRGCGILLVEHDMALVREICDHVYLLEFGQLIFEGTPEQMLTSDTVRSAYLGDTAPAGALDQGLIGDPVTGPIARSE